MDNGLSVSPSCCMQSVWCSPVSQVCLVRTGVLASDNGLSVSPSCCMQSLWCSPVSSPVSCSLADNGMHSQSVLVIVQSV